MHMLKQSLNLMPAPLQNIKSVGKIFPTQTYIGDYRDIAFKRHTEEQEIGKRVDRGDQAIKEYRYQSMVTLIIIYTCM